jgi:pimeloyl-ACP methyl ester carboxylesterase
MKKNIRNLALLTGLTGAGIHMINKFIIEKADMKKLSDSATGHFYETRNGNVFYTKRGTGTPLILIHNLDPISSSYEWCRIVKKLQKNHTVYTIDLLGCGLSEKPYLTYTNYMYVQILNDFIKDILSEKPDVVVTNRSVAIAILAENMNPGLIKHIIAINPPAIGAIEKTDSKISEYKKVVLELPIVGTLIYNILTSQRSISYTLRTKMFNRQQLVSSRMIDAYYESAHKSSCNGRYLMASIAAGYIDNNISHALKKLDIPLSIIESRTSTASTAISRAYANGNPSINTTFISNAGLLPQLESPDKLLSIIHMLID